MSPSVNNTILLVLLIDRIVSIAQDNGGYNTESFVIASVFLLVDNALRVTLSSLAG